MRYLNRKQLIKGTFYYIPSEEKIGSLKAKKTLPTLKYNPYARLPNQNY